MDSKGFATGAWDSSNNEILMRNTEFMGGNFGNELSGNGIGAKVAPDQYASDINHLQNIVQDIYAGFEVKPLMLAPGGFFDPSWFAEFLDKTPKSLLVFSHHVYKLGPRKLEIGLRKGSDKQLIQKILNPSVLSSMSETFSSLQSILKHSGTSAVAWVGEAGGAYNSGCNLVINVVVFSFWYLDQLGIAISHGTKTYCRQTLIGGNYGLLDTNFFVPNPDYYSALLWHRLMGNKVLSTSFSRTKKMRAYAHRSKKTQGIPLLLINPEKHTTVLVRFSTENTASSETLNMHPRTKFSTRPQDSIPIENITKEEYHLTAKHEHLESQNVFLNGNILNVDPSEVIPPSGPINKNVSEPITVAPFTIVFAVIPNIDVPACQ